VKFNFDKSILITLIVVVTILVGVRMVLNSIEGFSEDTITVNGVSTVKALPDLVVVNFQISTEGKTSEIAREANAKIFEDFENSLLNLGYKKEDLKTQNYNIYEEFDWSSSRRTSLGYRASRTIRVEVLSEDTKKASEVIDAGVKAGAGISYINYELTTESQNRYKAEAMKSAATDASVKASAVAQGFNKKVGKLVSTRVSNYDYSPWVAYSGSGMKMEAADDEVQVATSSIQPTEQEIYASVTAVYKLK
jgi:uncharacterized protein YggE